MKKPSKRFLLILALLLNSAWGLALQFEPGQCDSLIMQGQAAYGSRDHQKLSVLLTEATGKTCEPHLLYWLARSLNRQGLRDSARLYFNRILNEPLAIDTLLLGDVHYWKGRSYRSDEVYEEAVAALLKSLILFDSVAYPAKHARSLNALGNAYMDMGDMQKALTYREAYVKSMAKSGNLRRLTIAYLNLATTLSYTDSLRSKTIFQRALVNEQRHSDENLRAIIHQNLGALFIEKFQQFDSAKYHYNIARGLYVSTGESVLDLDINIAAIKEYQGDWLGARNGYLEALEQIEALEDKSYQLIIYGNLAGINEKLGNYKQAYEYERKRAAVSELLVNEEKNRALVEAETRYKTAEQDKQIIGLEIDKRQAEFEKERAATLAWIAALVLLVVGLVAYFLLKNYRARRVIAEQQSRLDKQRVVELVRQQELIGFDAMVLGQNNERKRLAEALHDHLGSLMATLKLRFESFWLKLGMAENTDQSAYDSLVDQIDQACDEVRKVSHDTRSGILISEGLLPAIKELAGNINESGSINIEVSGFGLNTGLEGTIELAIYRIVQELLTNIIKHSEARNASVQLTMHENSLNILIEDQGKGFEPKSKTDGVGLKSIRSRVNYLKGEMAIDSHSGRGTTVNLDIPLNS